LGEYDIEKIEKKKGRRKILSLFGGFLGLAVGLGGAYVVTIALKLPFLYPGYVYEIGVLVAIIAGVAAGVYPEQSGKTGSC